MHTLTPTTGAGAIATGTTTAAATVAWLGDADSGLAED